MLIDFNPMEERTISHLNGGDGAVSAKMFLDSGYKMMVSRLPAGASIGLHPHEDSCEINYVLSGAGRALCDGREELLSPGRCHCCLNGSSHSIANTGTEDLVLFTVVLEL